VPGIVLLLLSLLLAVTPSTTADSQRRHSMPKVLVNPSQLEDMPHCFSQAVWLCCVDRLLTGKGYALTC
jgi:hypothetical protein